MIDEFWHCDCKRLSPEAPVPVASLTQKTEELGGAGNVAHNLRALDSNIEIFLGGWLPPRYNHLLDKYCITLWEQGSWCDIQANIKLRIVDNSKGYHLVRVDNEDYVGYKRKPLPYDSILAWLNSINPDALILSDYCKGAITPELAQSVISSNTAKEVFVDTRRDDVEIFRGANWLTPNKHEMRRILAYNKIYEEPNIGNISELCQKIDLQGILLTRGSEGMDIYANQGKTHYHCDSVNHAIVDVTGAGDTSIAAFTLIRAMDFQDYEQILTYTNKLAGEVCMYRGTAVPAQTFEEYYKWEYKEEKKNKPDCE